MAKQEIIEHDDAYQVIYDGFSQIVSKEIVKNETEAVKFANEQYKIWQAQQANQKAIIEG